MTTLLFSHITLTFKVISGGVTGNSILDELSGFINTDLVELKVDAQGVEVWYVTTEGSSQVQKICEEVKQSLEKSYDARLSYSIVSIDL